MRASEINVAGWERRRVELVIRNRLSWRDVYRVRPLPSRRFGDSCIISLTKPRVDLCLERTSSKDRNECDDPTPRILALYEPDCEDRAAKEPWIARSLGTNVVSYLV